MRLQQGGEVTCLLMDPDARIDHDGPVTPYRQLAAILTARIERGDWKPGRRIASEHELMSEYGLARTTVRRAIDVLVDGGVAYTVPQRGTYVSEGRPNAAP